MSSYQSVIAHCCYILSTETDESSDEEIRAIVEGHPAPKAPCSERHIPNTGTSKSAPAKEVQLPGKSKSTNGVKSKRKLHFSKYLATSSPKFINAHLEPINSTGTASPTPHAQFSSVNDFDGETIHLSTPHGNWQEGLLPAHIIQLIHLC